MALYIRGSKRASVKSVPFLYRWTHNTTGKWYVGSRTAPGCNPDDGYICSSKDVKPMIIEDRSSWKREILCVGDAEYIRNLEASYLVIVNAKNDPMSYNRHNGDGKFTTLGRKEPADKLAARILKLTGKKKPVGFGNVVSKYKLGTKVSEETRKLIGLASSGRIQSIEARRKNSERNSGKNNSGFVGYYVSPNGIIYESSRVASRDFGVVRQTIVNWAKSNKNGWSFKAKEVTQ